MSVLEKAAGSKESATYLVRSIVSGVSRGVSVAISSWASFYYALLLCELHFYDVQHSTHMRSWASEFILGISLGRPLSFSAVTS